MIRGIVLGSIFLMAAATPALAFRTEDNAQVRGLSFKDPDAKIDAFADHFAAQQQGERFAPAFGPGFDDDAALSARRSLGIYGERSWQTDLVGPSSDRFGQLHVLRDDRQR